MRFVSEAQRRAVFAQIKNPYDFNVPGKVQPVKIALNRDEIEQRFRMNAALMHQDQQRLKQLPEDNETEIRRVQHRIANYRRRMSSAINSLVELGIDTTPYKAIRDGKIASPRQGVQPSTPSAPDVSPLKRDMGMAPVAGSEPGLIASSISPGIRPEMISDSLYKQGESLLTSPSPGRYQGGLASIMPSKWKPQQSEV